MVARHPRWAASTGRLPPGPAAVRNRLLSSRTRNSRVARSRGTSPAAVPHTAAAPPRPCRPRCGPTDGGLLEQRVQGITRASSLPVQQRGVFQQQSRIVLFDFHSGCWNGGPSPAADISPAHPRFCPQHANAVHDWWFRSTPPPMLGAPPMMRFSCGCFMPPPRLDQVPVGRPSPAVPEHNIGPGARGASTD
ncbi:hypothetical protein V5799_026223 [Amblyomma americanum]|uniref:Uncharacterized protein n=1 Tax=Amblyomma americanum TaxID=6943 RepID=A0AAQ4DJ70_AMBAM